MRGFGFSYKFILYHFIVIGSRSVLKCIDVFHIVPPTLKLLLPVETPGVQVAAFIFWTGLGGQPCLQ